MRNPNRVPRRVGAFLAPAVLVLGAMLVPAGAGAVSEGGDGERDRVAREQIGSDQFIAGSTVRVDQPLAGDLVAFGGHVAVEAPVGGDVLVSAGTVRLDAGVGQSVYVAGGHVAIAGAVERNVRAAAGRLEIAREATVRGNVTIGGGEVEVDGAVTGYLQVAGGHVIVDAPVGGDVVATTGHLELGPHARIGGRVRYVSGNEIDIDGAAQVAHGVERLEFGGAGAPREAVVQSRGHRLGWAWTAGLMLLAAVLVAAWPAFLARVGRTVRREFGWCLLVGLVALVAIPIVAVVLLATIVGIPLSLLALAAYAVLLLAGYVTTATAFGDWVLSRLRADALASPRWRVAAAALAMLAIGLLARIPYFGGLVVLVALLVGIGALLLQLRPTRPGAAAS